MQDLKVKMALTASLLLLLGRLCWHAFISLFVCIIAEKVIYRFGLNFHEILTIAQFDFVGREITIWIQELFKSFFVIAL